MSAVKLHFKVPRFVLWIGALSGIACFLLIALYTSENAPRGRRGPKIERLPTPLERPPRVPCVPAPDHEQWEFQTRRDAENYGLSDYQCRAAFPKLFDQVEKSVATRRISKITKEDLDSQKWLNGMVRGMVYNGELLIIHAEGLEGYRSRGYATLQALHRALISYPARQTLPNVEFVLLVEDFSRENVPRWVYSKQDSPEHTNVWLMPDFGYWSWPEIGVSSYSKFRRRAKAIDEGISEDGENIGRIDFQSKIKQLVWRGALNPNALRGKLYNLAKGKLWADVQYINWDVPKDVKKKVMAMEDYCKYSYLGHVEGRSYSGRLKYLQNCRSVIVSHSLNWIEAHHGALISKGPEQNYVEVRRDWGNLEDAVMHLIEHPELAEKIAENSVKTFRDRYLTPAAEACYWRRLIEGWASVSFEPHFFADEQKNKWRGVPFESFVLTNMTYA
jgi:hypothetical protein